MLTSLYSLEPRHGDTMQITCDCGEKSQHLPFVYSYAIGWTCFLCGKKHVFRMRDGRWIECVKGAWMPERGLVYHGVNGIEKTAAQIKRWKGWTAKKRPSPPAALSFQVVQSNHKPAGLPFEKFIPTPAVSRLFARARERDAQRCSLVAFNQQNKLCSALPLSAQIADLFAEAASLKGMRSSLQKELHRYQKL